MKNSPDQKPFKQAVNHHFAGNSLDNSQLKNLEAIQENTAIGTTKKAAPTWSKISYGIYAIALSIVIAVGIFLNIGTGNTPEQIAREVVKNHLYMKPLDINSSDIKEVSAYFTMLDFLPLKSSEYHRRNPLLLGGRYCSIKGVTAAQLRYKNTEGSLETLYQVPYDTDVFSDLPKLDEGEPPLVLYERGLEVTIWVEKGLLMVTSRPPK